jgi:tetratricopeptide (TPR) repeat protein
MRTRLCNRLVAALGVSLVVMLAGVSPAFGQDIPTLEARVLGDLNNDELWGDLGDAWARMGDAEMADGAWGVALLLDPDDSEWIGHSPALSWVDYVLDDMGVNNDEWIGDLGDLAEQQGYAGVAQDLYGMALEIDPADGEWQRKYTRGNGFPAAPPAGTAAAGLRGRLMADLSNDELWGDYGDALQAEGLAVLANGAWGVARILDQADGEWSGHQPLEALVDAGVLAAGITDDEWIGNLADQAATMGWATAAQRLYILALTLDQDDSEWRGRATLTPRK